eukprot:TRINITY_DN1418_c0_g1_i1.p1 TRINITY_DN1418_c0_g1~~TRINITY_DN1418_c0_g1_i1.p1  ORF type:complete len:467 (-),score=85.52 TRINITY_DN1418_c0_g1_i1:146-1513(-)
MGGGKLLLFLAFSLVLGISGKTSQEKTPQWGDIKYFTQVVDHFDPINQATYKQKYIVDDSAHTTGGPIFLFLGGEAPVEVFNFQEYLSRDLAAEFNAVYIALEHRYYSPDSMPVKDWSTTNLRYLSSRQALADAANFIHQMNNTYTGPWLIWGCSYSGALSAWFRAKYPNLVIGAIAPSGPVYATNNFSQYYGQWKKSVELAGMSSCINPVETAVDQISAMIKTESGRKSLTKTFKACKEIPAAEEEHYYFLETLVGVVGSADQFDNPPGWPLNHTCHVMQSTTDYVQNWAQLVGVDGDCNDFDEFTGFIQPMLNTTTFSDDRTWFWQKCTEFGWFTPTTPGSSVFFDNLRLEHQVEWCEKIFGIKGMTPDTTGTNEYYGGYDLIGTDILFTNGLFDPWHNLSIYKDINGVKAVTYYDGHCAPMDKKTDEDDPSLKHARVVVKHFIQDLLAKNQQ